MDRIDFERWYKTHCRMFPDIAQWVKKQPEPAGVLDEWLRVFSGIPLADAEEASRRMFSGEDDLPMGYSRHPRTIRAIAQSIAADRRREEGAKGYRETKTVDGLPVYACPVCCDEGVVEVWHPEAMRRARDGEEGARLRLTCATSCTCAAGDQKAHNKLRLLRYKSPPMIRCTDRYNEGELLEAMNL